MMIRSRDFSFSTDRLNNVVETLVGLGEIRPQVANEAKALAMYGGEIMSGRGSLERTLDIPSGSTYGDVLGSQTDLRYYTGENAEGLRASEQGVRPNRQRLRFSSDMDPEVLRVLQKSMKTNEGKRLFRLVRNDAIESGAVPQTKVTRASIMREIKSIYSGKEFKPSRQKGALAIADIAKARKEQRALGPTARPSFGRRTSKWQGRSVSYGTGFSNREEGSRGVDIVGEALGISGSESPEQRARFEEAKIQQQLAQSKVPVPLSGGRAAKQKDDPALERQMDRKVRSVQLALNNILRNKRRLIDSGRLTPKQIREFERREKELRAFLEKPVGTVSNTIDVAVRKANTMIERLQGAGTNVLRRLRSIARKQNPEFKERLAGVQARYERDVQLRRKAKSQEPRRPREQPKFRIVDPNVTIIGRSRPPVDVPLDPETQRRVYERGRYRQAANEEVRRLGGMAAASRAGRVVPPTPDNPARLLADLSPEVLRLPPASQFPPGARTERVAPGPARTATAEYTKGLQSVREYLAAMAAQDNAYIEDLKRFDDYIRKVETEAAAIAQRQAEARERSARTPQPEQKPAEVKPARKARNLVRGNPMSILRFLASRGIPLRPRS